MRFIQNNGRQSKYLYRITDSIDELDPETTVIYVAFTKAFLDSKIKEWEENKANATNHLYQLIGFLQD